MPARFLHQRDKRRDVLQKVRHIHAVDAVVGERQTARDVGEHVNGGRRDHVNSQAASALEVPAADVEDDRPSSRQGPCSLPSHRRVFNRSAYVVIHLARSPASAADVE